MQKLKAKFLRDALDVRQTVDAYLQPHLVDRQVCTLPDDARGVPVLRLTLFHSLAVGDVTCAGPMTWAGKIHRVVFPWSAVHFLIRADQLHCVDWSLIPTNTRVDGFEIAELRRQYQRMNPGARWSGDISVGPPIDWSEKPAPLRSARRMPNGWRVISGGKL